jgi:hypothetical protein
LTAKLHLAELVPFVGLLWVGIHFGGVTGAALVLSARVAADAALLFVAAGIFRAVVARLLPAIVLIGLSLVGAMFVGDYLSMRVALIVLLGTSSLRCPRNFSSLPT